MVTERVHIVRECDMALTVLPRDKEKRKERKREREKERRREGREKDRIATIDA